MSAAAEGNRSALLRRLEAAGPRLSAGRRQLVKGILANLSETVFLSSPELAARFQTDPATVVRTVQMLGYAGFGDFSRDLRHHFLADVNPYRVMEAEVSDHKGPADHVRRSLQLDLRNLQLAGDALDTRTLPKLGAALRRCRRVLVVAGDLEHCFADFLAYALSGLGIDASAPSGEGLTLQRQRVLTASDACIGIAFRRCLRVPVEAMRAARTQGALTLAITDAATTPLARFAEHSLLAPIEGESFASSYVAPLAVINALLVACAHADAKATLEQLKPTDAEYGVGLRWYREPAEAAPAPARRKVVRGKRRRAGAA